MQQHLAYAKAELMHGGESLQQTLQQPFKPEGKSKFTHNFSQFMCKRNILVGFIERFLNADELEYKLS